MIRHLVWDKQSDSCGYGTISEENPHLLDEWLYFNKIICEYA